jgi:hypothetical protein
VSSPARSPSAVVGNGSLFTPYADAAIDQACRFLRLPTIRDRHSEIVPWAP